MLVSQGSPLSIAGYSMYFLTPFINTGPLSPSTSLQIVMASWMSARFPAKISKTLSSLPARRKNAAHNSNLRCFISAKAFFYAFTAHSGSLKSLLINA